MNVKRDIIAFFTAALWIAAPTRAAFPEEPATKEIQFSISHPLKTVSGTCQSVLIQGFAPQNQGQEFVAAPFQVVIPIDGMTTGNRNRDSNMAEMLGYPGAKEITAKIPAVHARLGKNRLSGTVTINKIEKPFDGEFELTQNGDSFVIQGSTILHLSDFGIAPPRLLLLSIGNDVAIAYNVSFRK